MIKFKTVGEEIINADATFVKIKDAAGVRTFKSADAELEIFDFDRFKIAVSGEVVFEGQISEAFFPQLLELHKLLNGEAFKDEATLYEMQKSKFRFRSNLSMVFIMILLDFGIVFGMRAQVAQMAVCFIAAALIYAYIKFTIPKSPQSGFRFTIIDEFLLSGNFGVLVGILSILAIIGLLAAGIVLNWLGL